MKISSEDKKWICRYLAKNFLFFGVAIFGMVSVIYCQSLLEQEITFLQKIASCVGIALAIIVLILTVVPRSSFSHHNLICKPTEETRQRDV